MSFMEEGVLSEKSAIYGRRTGQRCYELDKEKTSLVLFKGRIHTDHGLLQEREYKAVHAQRSLRLAMPFLATWKKRQQA